MKHEIDLKKFNIHTDLIIEDNSIKTKYNIEKYKDITITKIIVNKNNQKFLNRKEGTYITIEFNDVTDIDNQNNLEKIFVKYLEKLMKNINKKRGLIIGLGNSNSTPDSLGPNVIKDIIVTTHLINIATLDEGFNEVAAFAPGVTGDTGIETSDIVINIINTIKPNYVIIIDSLASRSIERVNKTIQMNNSGISPGSGVGNNRKELNKDTLNIPVIAIGIPTVVDAVSIVADTINYMSNNKIKLINSNKLMNTNLREILSSVLTPLGYNLIVTPKEIDFTIKKLSNILSNGINKVIHPKLKIKQTTSNKRSNHSN